MLYFKMSAKMRTFFVQYAPLNKNIPYNFNFRSQIAQRYCKIQNNTFRLYIIGNAYKNFDANIQSFFDRNTYKLGVK